MADKLDQLQAALFAAPHGGVACDAINALAEHASKGDAKAKAILAEYTRVGSIGHMREHACAVLADASSTSDADLVVVFRAGLADPVLRYWSIQGYLRSAGQLACPNLIRIAQDTTIPLNERAHAIKCLAEFSRQPFDRQLPADPGYWKEPDLRIAEIVAWQKAAYPVGAGYSVPPRHPALDNPRTALEKVASRLDKKLSQTRVKCQDLAEPTNWLTIAQAVDLERIAARWSLPGTYLEFLTKFSPLRVRIEKPEFYNPFQLFGASELIVGQDGYSFNPVEQRPIDDWPPHLVVIAYHGGDPFVLDLSKSDGQDAPVDTAEHGMGDWQFERVAESFRKFLKSLAE